MTVVLTRLRHTTTATIKGQIMTKESDNVYAAVLAGGSGVRMGNPDKPKQFHLLGNKPIVVHTLEKFCASGSFSRVLLLCPETWIRQSQDLVERYCSIFAEQIDIVPGGAVRNETIMNAIEYIEVKYGANDDTILVTHDAVRPFVSYRIIEENIRSAKKNGACDTVVPATDTIIESLNGKTINAIPDRRMLYQGQTPQSFRMLHLKEFFMSLSEEEKAILTDACKALVLRGESVALVRGEESNIKITYPQDMRIALALIEEQQC